MTEPLNVVRARSFGSVADTYDRYRPEPPREAVDWVLPTGASHVLDLGAGTGALTRVLLEEVRGKVVAAEPDARMRAVLARRSPRALSVGARAEGLPFADASFDAVVVSSAWHWMDPARTVPEVARVLRPGGRLGVLGNGPDREIEWVAELLGRGGEMGGPVGRDAGRRHVELPPGAPFGPPETTVVSWGAPMTREELVGLTGTYSAVITSSDEDRAAILHRVERLTASHEVFAGGTSVDLPMACRCWRATRS